MTTTAKILFHVSSRALEEKITQIRQRGSTPANIYGLHAQSDTISLSTKSLFQHLKKEGETGLLYLVIDKKSAAQPVLFSEIQRHPVTNEIVHVSFLRVNLAEKITKEIDVKLVGLFEVKEATVLLVRNTLEVEALPADLPEAFYIDITKLTEVGQEVHVSDLEYDRSKIVVQLSEAEQAAPIALVQAVKEEVIEEQVVEEIPVEGETTTTTATTTPTEATDDPASAVPVKPGEKEEKSSK